jgi:hypothetical protein
MISAGRFGRDNVFVIDFGWDFVALLIQINAPPSICQLSGDVNRSDQPV